MKTYEKYKPSGVEWIGKVPEHWEVKRLGSFGKFSKGGGISRAELTLEGLPAILYGDLYTKYDVVIKEVFHRVSEETARKSKEINKNALLFTGSGETIEDIGKNAVYLGENPAYAGGDVIIFIQEKNDSLFLSYLLNSEGAKHEKAKTGKGEIIVHTYASKLREIQIPLPPLPEQTAIARYLDQKITEIDQLIAQKERLIALWEEEKTALISQAVTRGLDAGAKMKDSGVAWLGEVPEHWEVVKFNHYVKLRHGYQFRDFDFVEKGIKIIKITQLLSNGILETENVSYIDQERLSEFNDILIGSGDILMALTGGTIGKIVRAKEIIEPLLQNYRVGNFFPANKKLTKDFLFFILSSDVIIKQIFYEIRETGQPNIGKEDFNRMYFAFPQEVSEQTAIVRHIETQTARIQTQMDQTRKLIELLKEYRATLISEVVTGKVKITE